MNDIQSKDTSTDESAKRVRLFRQVGVQAQIDALRSSANQTRHALIALLQGSDALSIMAELKFRQVGHDPMDSSRRLNLIEQLNQTFTYLVAFKAAEFLFARHLEVSALDLNLGNASGWDIESVENELLVAEVFAAVKPANNQKLRKDIDKVRSAPHRYRYVIFMSPEHHAGPHAHTAAGEDVTVWSLGSFS